MPDEPFYSPTKTPTPPPPPKPTEPLWAMHCHQEAWACELLCHGQWGWEARLLKGGKFWMSYRFLLKDDAIAWGTRERSDIERGFVDLEDPSL